MDEQAAEIEAERRLARLRAMRSIESTLWALGVGLTVIFSGYVLAEAFFWTTVGAAERYTVVGYWVDRAQILWALVGLIAGTGTFIFSTARQLLADFREAAREEG